MPNSALNRESVSVLIPTFNEEEYLGGILESLHAQSYGSEHLEILVIDGRSEDATREIAQDWVDRLTLRIVDNPKRKQSPGLNLGLAQATHDLIVRLDAHARYADDYVERCMDALESSDAMMVGGPMRPEGLTAFGEAVTVATTTPVGVGPGRFHYSEEREYVDTVFLGSFRKDEIIALGAYDESLDRAAEDAELAYRITKAGGKILLDPAIRSVYYPRSSPSSLFKQYHNYGMGKAATLAKHQSLPTWRPLAPAAFTTWLLLGPILTQHRWSRGLFLSSLAGYLGVVGWVSLDGADRNLPLAARTTGAITVMHTAYGVGFWRGIIETAIARIRRR